MTKYSGTFTSRELEDYLHRMNSELILDQEIRFSWYVNSEGNYQATISQEAIEDLITLINKN